MKKKSPILTKLARYLLSSLTSGPLCDLRSTTLAQMKGINVLSKNLRGNNFLVRVGGRYLKKTSPILTKLAKYLLSSVTSGPLCDLRSTTLAQMKGINVLSKNLRGNNFLVPVGGRYLKKTSPILTELAKYWLSSVTYGPLCDLRESTVAQMKGINALSKNLRGNNFLVCAGGRYLKKTSSILTKLAKFCQNWRCFLQISPSYTYEKNFTTQILTQDIDTFHLG